jgi:hypothetical protein
MLVDLLMEGKLETSVAKRLFNRLAIEVGTVVGEKGYNYLATKLPELNKNKRGAPFFVLMDFKDTGALCPSDAILDLVKSPHRNPNLLLRLAVQEIESWLMADREGLAQYLSIPLSKLPRFPDRVARPKSLLVRLGSGSKKKVVRDGFIPMASASQGPGYTGLMQLFVENHWNIERAKERSSSLQRCLRRLEEFRDQTMM